MAATIATRIAKYICRAFIKIIFDKFYWAGLTVMLQWMSGKRMETLY